MRPLSSDAHSSPQGFLTGRGVLVLLVLVAASGAWWWKSHQPVPVVNNPPRSGPIVAFGDSLTYGIGADKGQSYPDQLSQLIGRPIVNCGYPGDTVTDAARRLDSEVLAQKPSIVIVLLGGNDFLQRKNLSQSFIELEQIIHRIQGNGALVVLVGMTSPLPLGNIGGQFKSLAQRAGVAFVPDILANIMGNRALMADDNHPNAQGYALVAQRMAKALAPYLH